MTRSRPGHLHRRHGRAVALAGRWALRQATSPADPDHGRLLVTIAGISLLLAMVIGSPSVWAFTPGLMLIGLGLGLMLTPSVNVVQSAFPEERQGEISGMSRSVSNLGSSLGTAIAGTILVAGITVAAPSAPHGLAMIVLAVVGLVGLTASALLPRTTAQPTPRAQAMTPEALGTSKLERANCGDKPSPSLRRLCQTGAVEDLELACTAGSARASCRDGARLRDHSAS